MLDGVVYRRVWVGALLGPRLGSVGGWAVLLGLGWVELGLSCVLLDSVG